MIHSGCFYSPKFKKGGEIFCLNSSCRSPRAKPCLGQGGKRSHLDSPDFSWKFRGIEAPKSLEGREPSRAPSCRGARARSGALPAPIPLLMEEWEFCLHLEPQFLPAGSFGITGSSWGGFSIQGKTLPWVWVAWDGTGQDNSHISLNPALLVLSVCPGS